MDAPNYGVHALQCASGAAADGTSNPPAERVVANLRALGHRVIIDPEALSKVASYFTRPAEAEGLLEAAAGLRCQLSATSVAGRDGGHDASASCWRVASHTWRERSSQSSAVSAKSSAGRSSMTPFSQILLTQAVMNVTARERYAIVPDEAIRYAIGRFGKPNVPIDANVLDRTRVPAAHSRTAGRGPNVGFGGRTASSPGSIADRRGVAPACHHACRPG